MGGGKSRMKGEKGEEEEEEDGGAASRLERRTRHLSQSLCEYLA